MFKQPWPLLFFDRPALRSLMLTQQDTKWGSRGDFIGCSLQSRLDYWAPG